MFGETIACAAVSPHVYLLSYIQAQCYPPLRQLHSDSGDFNKGVSHVSKITMADSNLHMGLLQQHSCRFNPDVLARVKTMPVMIMSIASDRGQIFF